MRAHGPCHGPASSPIPSDFSVVDEPDAASVGGRDGSRDLRRNDENSWIADLSSSSTW